MSSELAEVLLGLNNQQNKMYHFMTCVQNRNRLKDVENKLLVTKRRCIWGEINQELHEQIPTSIHKMGFPGGSAVKTLPPMQETSL